MEFALGCAVLAATAAGIWGSFHAFNRGRRRVALALIIATGALVRIYAGTHAYLGEWDERYHALVAKHLVAHPLRPTLYDTPLLPYDHRDWCANHVWLHKPPLALWLIAGSLALFGTVEWAVRLPSLLLSTAQIGLTHSLGRRLFSARIGLTAALFHAVNPLLIGLATGRKAVDHVDTVFVFLVEFAIWLGIVAWRRWPVLATVLSGLVTGLALLTKWLPGLVVAPVLFAYRRRTLGRRGAATVALLIALVGLAVALPWNIYTARAFPVEYRWEQGYNWQHLFRPAEHHWGTGLFYVLRLPLYFGELVWLPAFWFLRSAWKRPRPRRSLLLAWFGLPLLVYSLAATKQVNYIALAAPALCLIMAWFWWVLHDAPPRSRVPRHRRLLIVLLMVLPVLQVLPYVDPWRAAARTPAWADRVRGYAGPIGAGPAVLFNTDRPIEAMFYTDAVAYPHVPRPEVLEDLVRRGYTVFIVRSPDVPEQTWTLPGVRALEPAADP